MEYDRKCDRVKSIRQNDGNLGGVGPGRRVQWCEPAHLQPRWPGFDSRTRAICGLSLLLVLFLFPRGFSPGAPVFSSLQKLAPVSPLLKTKTRSEIVSG